MFPSISNLRAEPTATGCLLTWTVDHPAALHYLLLHVHDRPGKPPRTRTLPAYARSARISLPLVTVTTHGPYGITQEPGYLCELRPVVRGGAACTVAPALAAPGTP